MSERLLELAKRDKAEAYDNLTRAKAAAIYFDPSREWGKSGKTLQSIIDGYEQWHREASATVDSLTAAAPKP